MGSDTALILLALTRFHRSLITRPSLAKADVGGEPNAPLRHCLQASPLRSAAATRDFSWNESLRSDDASALDTCLTCGSACIRGRKVTFGWSCNSRDETKELTSPVGRKDLAAAARIGTHLFPRVESLADAFGTPLLSDEEARCAILPGGRSVGKTGVR